MSVLTDFYRFERIAQKAKHRMDCTASTESYPEFENRRATKAYKETEKRDAIIQAGAVIEVFIARGKSNECNTLCNLYSDGELDEEMNALRQQVTKTVTEPEKA